jgi:hypothetical protein
LEIAWGLLLVTRSYGPGARLDLPGWPVTVSIRDRA